MSLDKAIKYGKEHRKPYYGAKSVSCACRNNGSCDYCRSNRMIQTMKERAKTKAKLKDLY